MKNIPNTLKQAGISLLEVLLSLAIIAIILVMAIGYFSSASTNQKMNIVRNIIGADMSAVQSYGINNNSDFTGVTIQKLVDNGYLSQDTKNISCSSSSSCTQKSPWGDDMEISNISGSNVTLGFKLPSNLCKNLQDGYGQSQVDCGTTGKAVVYLNGSVSSTPTPPPAA